MALTQDRIIALIDVADALLASRERLEGAANAELSAALDAFYESVGNENALASEMLARLQSVVALISASVLSATMIATLAREREHFRLARSKNEAAARSMRRRRRLDRGEPVSRSSDRIEL